MKIVRVIEEFNRSEDMEYHYKRYVLNITAKQILDILDDFILFEKDNKDEIYAQYNLTQSQIEKLKPYLIDSLEENFEKYSYELGCYEDE